MHLPGLSRYYTLLHATIDGFISSLIKNGCSVQVASKLNTAGPVRAIIERFAACSLHRYGLWNPYYERNFYI